MQRICACMAAVALVVAVGGCNTAGRQPKLRNAEISPSQLSPNDSALITVNVVDKHDVVERVVGVVQEDPRAEFTLRDDGTMGDVAAGDGVWSFKVDVPVTAPPGAFTLVITAYNAEGEAVLVRGDSAPVPLTASTTLQIVYPSNEAPPETPSVVVQE